MKNENHFSIFKNNRIQITESIALSINLGFHFFD